MYYILKNYYRNMIEEYYQKSQQQEQYNATQKCNEVT